MEIGVSDELGGSRSGKAGCSTWVVLSGSSSDCSGSMLRLAFLIGFGANRADSSNGSIEISLRILFFARNSDPVPFTMFNGLEIGVFSLSLSAN